MRKNNHIRSTNPLANRLVSYWKIQIIEVFEWMENTGSAVKTFPQSSMLPCGISGRAKGGKDRADKVLGRDVSTETGDLGRFASVEATGKVLVKASGKPGMVGLVPGPIRKLDKGRNKPIA